MSIETSSNDDKKVDNLYLDLLNQKIKGNTDIDTELIETDTETDSVLNETDSENIMKVNGWSDEAQAQLEICLWKLKYNRIINNFYFSELKKEEAQLSWYIILISTLTSGLTVANNVKEEPFQYFRLSINISLTSCSMITSLIATWMKKKQYIERINDVDRYFQKLNKLCEEVNFELLKIHEDRSDYITFKEVSFPKISEYLIPNPAITPQEWKKCVYEITTNYPELLNPDDTEENKMWPWYGDYKPKTDELNNIIINEDGSNILIREKTDFTYNILKSYKNYFWRCFCLKKNNI